MVRAHQDPNLVMLYRQLLDVVWQLEFRDDIDDLRAYSWCMR